MHKLFIPIFFVVFTCALFIAPQSSAHASDSKLTISGWIPYWRDTEGIKDAKKHSAHIDTVYPFAFTVKTDGSLSDQAGLEKKDWKSFRKFALGKDIEVIPTIMWSDTDSIHRILSSTTTRTEHIKGIVSMVAKGKYTGVDIDYEGKKSETINSFSRFLIELKEKLGDERILSCTIEARTPPDSLYREVPTVTNYANDYTQIDRACDRIVIMAYDQQRADLKADDARKGSPYVPVADPLWVEKAIKLALESFDADKIVLGIPSYGRHWAMTVAPEWYRDYRSIGALNVPDMLDVAKENKVAPTRNKAGEMSFSYLPKTTDSKIAKAIQKMSAPKNTPKGELISAKALAYATKYNTEVTVNVGWYSDAGAMIDKIELADTYNLRGVSFFKIDGEEDQKVWTYLKNQK